MKTTSFQGLGLRSLLLHFWQMQLHSCTYAGPAAASRQLHDIFDEYDDTMQQGARCQLSSSVILRHQAGRLADICKTDR